MHWGNDWFLDKANKRHSHRYIYNHVVYQGAKMPVTIKCPTHGLFQQTPDKHLRGQGCPKCGIDAVKNKLRGTFIEFTERADQHYNHKFDYSGVCYVNIDTEVTIKCPTHGLFQQTPYHHLNGKHGCPECSSIHSKTSPGWMNETYIQRANVVHNNRFDYSQIDYQNAKTKIAIICRDHGPFNLLPRVHLPGRGCALCAGRGYYSAKFFSEDLCRKIKPAFFYCLDFGEFFKVGITINIKHRLAVLHSDRHHKFNIKKIQQMPLWNAWIKEQQFLRYIHKAGLNHTPQPPLVGYGNSECFVVQPTRR